MRKRTSALDQRLQVPSPPARPSYAVAGQLIRGDADDLTDLERECLAFEVDDDLAAIIPMPESIAISLRAAITLALGQRFEFATELDEWLHAPNGMLKGASPYERIIAGDAIAVLRALGVLADGADRSPADCGTTPPPLRLER